MIEKPFRSSYRSRDDGRLAACGSVCCCSYGCAACCSQRHTLDPRDRQIRPLRPESVRWNVREPCGAQHHFCALRVSRTTGYINRPSTAPPTIQFALTINHRNQHLYFYHSAPWSAQTNPHTTFTHPDDNSTSTNACHGPPSSHGSQGESALNTSLSCMPTLTHNCTNDVDAHNLQSLICDTAYTCRTTPVSTAAVLSPFSETHC